MYLMEDAICGLHSQKANLSFLILGGKHGVNYYMGISLPPGDIGNGAPEDDETELAYSSLKSILHSVYNGVDIYKDSFSADTIQSMISPLANNIGVVTGIPALKSTGGDTSESEQIERLASGLSGHDFGMLVLAVPIPNAYVTKEEFAVVDKIQGAQETKIRKRKSASSITLSDGCLSKAPSARYCSRQLASM